ncbi:MAG TPA: pilin [Patescibacteria group bacterium]|nr:pilin [Patescibacteria group bacterium]
MNLLHIIAAANPNLPSVSNPLPKVPADPAELNKILSIVFVVTGAISVLIITIAGFRYTLSNGDPQATTRARNTIIYAAIGLVISISAFAIVSFVVGRL